MRRFWQGSTDHRGIPGAPGRVVTLVRQAPGICWGMAYRIGAADGAAVLAHLDYREKGGYSLETILLHWRDAEQSSREGMVYLARPDNLNYLGPAPADVIARQIRTSTGPSGPNDEYLARLADALRAMNAIDEHVFEIEAQLLKG